MDFDNPWVFNGSWLLEGKGEPFPGASDKYYYLYDVYKFNTSHNDNEFNSNDNELPGESNNVSNLLLASAVFELKDLKTEIRKIKQRD